MLIIITFTYSLACSQTLYFLFKVRRACVIKNKNRRGFIDRQRKRVGVGEEENRRLTWGRGFFFPKDVYRRSSFFFLALANVFEKNEKKNKVNQRLCTGYLQPAFQSLESFYVSWVEFLLLWVFRFLSWLTHPLLPSCTPAKLWTPSAPVHCDAKLWGQKSHIPSVQPKFHNTETTTTAIFIVLLIPKKRNKIN